MQAHTFKNRHKMECAGNRVQQRSSVTVSPQTCHPNFRGAEKFDDDLSVVIFLTAYGDSETVAQAKQTTPFGYLLKPFDSDTLRANIEIALYRQTQETAKRRRSRPQRFTLVEAAMKLGQSKRLTDTELRTLELLATGLSLTTIATVQCRSPNTVKFHLRNTYRKLNVKGRSDLLRLLR